MGGSVARAYNMLEELDGVKFPVAVNGQHLKKYFPSMWEGE